MDHAADHSTNGSGHEHREADLKLVVWGAIGLAVSTVIIMILVWGMFNVLKTTEQTEANEQALSPLATPGQLPPEPRLTAKPYEELQRLRAHEEDVLKHYGWQDPKNGIVHIPIDKAMDIVAQQGPYGGKIEPAKPVAKVGKP
jgi:hypothetical protein